MKKVLISVCVAAAVLLSGCTASMQREFKDWQSEYSGGIVRWA